MLFHVKHSFAPLTHGSARHAASPSRSGASGRSRRVEEMPAKRDRVRPGTSSGLPGGMSCWEGSAVSGRPSGGKAGSGRPGTSGRQPGGGTGPGSRIGVRRAAGRRGGIGKVRPRPAGPETGPSRTRMPKGNPAHSLRCRAAKEATLRTDHPKPRKGAARPDGDRAPGGKGARASLEAGAPLPEVEDRSITAGQPGASCEADAPFRAARNGPDSIGTRGETERSKTPESEGQACRGGWGNARPASLLRPHRSGRAAPTALPRPHSTGVAPSPPFISSM